MSRRHVLLRDAETRSLLDLPRVGAWRYAAEPTTGAWCVAYAVDDDPPQIWTPDQPIPEAFSVAANDPDWIVVAHNDQFETALETRVLAPRYGWPLVPLERHRCTMAMALASALPGGLKAAAEALGIPQGKDVEGAWLMRRMSRPRKPRAGEDPNGIYWDDDPAHLERLCTYCKRDTELERELFRRLSPLIDPEQTLWLLDQQINRRGFYTDGQLLPAASRIAAAAGQAAQEELARITAGALTSTDQVKALQTWLGEHDCEVKDLRKPTLGHALRRKGFDPIVRRVIELRLGAAHAAAAKIDSLRAWRDADGRVRGTLKFYDASTGRWSAHGPQPQNFKRDGDGIEAKLTAIATGDLAHVAKLYPQPLEIVGDIARGMICAAPGHRLLIGDFSGIESRVLAWISDQRSKLEQWAKFDRTGDPHDEPYYLLGRRCGQPEESARKIGKTADLAFGYMGGPGAWNRLAPEDDATSDADKRRYQQTWRSTHPQTVQFWTSINRAAIYAVDKPGTTFSCRRLAAVYDDKTFLRITLPHGRSLSYPFPRLATDKFGNAMIMFKDNAAGKFVDCRYGQGAYGGLWTENIVQAVSRDLLAGALTRLEAAGYHIVLHVHDEVVTEVPESFGSVEEFQHILTTLPTWADGLPVAVKVRAGARFCKLETAAAKPDAVIPDDLRIPNFLLRCPAPPMAAAADEDVDEDKPDGKPGDDHAGVVSDELAAILAAGGNDDSGASIGLHAGDPGVHHGDDRTAGGTTETDQDGGAASDGGNSGGGNGHDHGRRFDDYPHGERRTGRRLATYIYRDHLGANHTKVEKWRSPTAKRAHYPQRFWVQGRWVSDKPKGWLHVPYRLQEMLSALAKDPSTDVFVPEGEKDADNIAALGLVGTTSAEGATPLRAKTGKWTPELSRWFYGVRRLFIPADNDEVGRAFAKEKARALETIVPSISIVLFPDVPEGEDVSYWLNELGHSKEELLARCEAAERWQGSGYVLVRASDIVPRPMDWLWQGHILRGSQELLTGVPGGGKSQIHCAFVSYVTTGRAWPNGCNGAPAGNVIMLTAEDCLDQTITPRLIAAGADRDRVFILKKIRKDNKERMFLLSEDIEELEHIIAKTGDVRLITIDPITAFMGSGGRFDSHRAVDVRGQLGPLADLAERMDVALSAITHPPKAASQRGIDHFIGSQAFIAAARIGHLAIEEVDDDKIPTGRSLFANVKNNVSRKMSTLAYRIVEKPLADGVTAAGVVWEEIVDISADQAVAAAAPAHKERGQQSDVIIFLMNLLANGPVAMKTIEDNAAECRYSKDQLHRAKRKMGVVAFKEEGTLEGRWFWALAQHALDKKDTDEA